MIWKKKETRKTSLVGKGAGIYQNSSSRSSIYNVTFSSTDRSFSWLWLKCHDSFSISFFFCFLYIYFFKNCCFYYLFIFFELTRERTIRWFLFNISCNIAQVIVHLSHLYIQYISHLCDPGFVNGFNYFNLVSK